MLKGAVTSMVMTGANILREGVSQAVLELNFDPAQMFTYTNVITNSMMPLVYISAGFSLGFTIIYSLRSGFITSSSILIRCAQMILCALKIQICLKM